MAEQSPQKNDGGRPWQVSFWMIMAFVIALSLLARGLVEHPSPAPVSELAYTELKQRIEDGTIAEMEMSGAEIRAATEEGGLKDRARGEIFVSVAPPGGDPELLPLIEAKGVKLYNRVPGDSAGALWLIPWVLIIGFYIWMVYRMRRGVGPFAGGAGDFLGGKAWKTTKERVDVTFADVAGQDSAKREVAELIDFLKDPERFAKVGAQPPRGVLLMGPPGTGKTLLARALAGEAGVPFYSTSGSAFIELFVGVGASRVRRMFEEARKNAPAIVFIDELDSIGRVRGTGLGGGHDEREQTLNQILAELDGFSGREAVVVIAATNRPDVLDPALLRPGRFDRHVTLSLPDKAGRRAILDVHARKVVLAPEVDLDQMAAGTPGFSGADLKNLINEAAISAARRSAGAITMADLDAARDKVMMGTVRTLAIKPEEKHRIAVHEAGHAAAAYYLPDADPLYKVSIIPRGQSLGGTHMLPEEERHTLPEAYLRSQLSIMLAGRVSEKLFLGSVSSGADDDIARATSLARSMAARWGMAKEVGPIDLRQSEDHPFLGREIAQPRRFSDITAAHVDEAVARLMREAEKRAEEVLAKHRHRIQRLIDRLEAEETLGHDAIVACLRPGGPVIAADNTVN